MRGRGLVSGVALATVLVTGSIFGLPSQAKAVTLTDTWDISGQFNDGGTLSGYVTFDQYGYMAIFTHDYCGLPDAHNKCAWHYLYRPFGFPRD